MKRLQSTVDYEGQRYVDQPVYRTISVLTKGARSVQIALRHMHMRFRIPMATACAEPTVSTPLPPSIEDLTHHERIRLRWMRPDGKGGLMPR